MNKKKKLTRTLIGEFVDKLHFKAVTALKEKCEEALKPYIEENLKKDVKLQRLISDIKSIETKVQTLNDEIENYNKIIDSLNDKVYELRCEPKYLKFFANFHYNMYNKADPKTLAYNYTVFFNDEAYKLFKDYERKIEETNKEYRKLKQTVYALTPTEAVKALQELGFDVTWIYKQIEKSNIPVKEIDKNKLFVCDSKGIEENSKE